MLYLVGKKIGVAALLLLASFAAQAAVLECPINAPADWKAPKSRLDRARVFAYLPSTQADERALAEGLPEKEWQMFGTLYQSWNMKAGSRGMVRQVYCSYTGTPRFVRFDARSTARCLAKRRVRGDALMTGSLEFRCR
jgi:hypothetical protein